MEAIIVIIQFILMLVVFIRFGYNYLHKINRVLHKINYLNNCLVKSNNIAGYTTNFYGMKISAKWIDEKNVIKKEYLGNETYSDLVKNYRLLKEYKDKFIRKEMLIYIAIFGLSILIISIL